MLVVFALTLRIANPWSSTGVPGASVASVRKGGPDEIVDS